MKSLEQYIPRIKTKYIIIGGLITFVALIALAKLERDNMLRLGSFIILSKNYNKEMTLSLQDRLKYESLIKEYDKQIALVIGEGTPEKLQEDRFIQKASSLSSLGQWNNSLKTLYQGFSYYPKSAALREALAIVYDQLGEYKIAIRNYENVLQNYADHRGDYQQKIIQLYIKLKDPENAGKYYIDYMKMGGEKNLDLMNQVRELKGLGPLADFQQPVTKTIPQK